MSSTDSAGWHPSSSPVTVTSMTIMEASMQLHFVNSLQTMLLPRQDENEEMGRELAEGKLHAVERQAALAKTFADDLRKAFAEVLPVV